MATERLGMAVVKSQEPKKPTGRPRRVVPLKKLYAAFAETKSVRAAARAVDVPPGVAWDRLHGAGII